MPVRRVSICRVADLRYSRSDFDHLSSPSEGWLSGTAEGNGTLRHGEDETIKEHDVSGECTAVEMVFNRVSGPHFSAHTLFLSTRGGGLSYRWVLSEISLRNAVVIGLFRLQGHEIRRVEGRMMIGKRLVAS